MATRPAPPTAGAPGPTIDELLAGMEPGMRTAWSARAHRASPTLRSLTAALYGASRADALTDRLLHAAARATAARRPALVARDVARSVDPLWFHDHRQVGYSAYAARFGGTLAGVAGHLDHLTSLGVTYLHLMHVLRAREGDSDGGYALVDFGDVEPALGTRADLVELADSLHLQGLNLCLDVVLNHTAAEHEWATAAKAGSARHRDYYLTFTDRADVDAYEATLPEVFPEIAPGSFTWSPELDAWVWTTFHGYQWDLDYANPDVLCEMVDVVLDLAGIGADVLRLDAIAFTWKRLGTTCQNQPEVHLLAQLLRAVVDVAAPGVVLQAEAIVAPTELVAYLGAHRLRRDECQLAYHNQLMVDVWDALARGDARLATAALAALPQVPEGSAWTTYLRCHDDIGWAIDDGVAASLSISGRAHRAHLAAFYRGDVWRSWARGAAFSTNPLDGDERTCGMSAALCGITAALAEGDEPALDLAIRRLLLGYAIVFGFGGIPLIYMGDEVALGNDAADAADPRHAADSRWLHRPAMDWVAVARAAVAGTVEHRVCSGMARLIEARTCTPAMSGGGQTWLHEVPAPSVLAWERRHPVHGRFYGVANVAAAPVSLPAVVLSWAGLEAPIEVLGAGAVLAGGELRLPPLCAGWFVDAHDAGVQPPTVVRP